jgi:hypothetical protein
LAEIRAFNPVLIGRSVDPRDPDAYKYFRTIRCACNLHSERAILLSQSPLFEGPIPPGVWSVVEAQIFLRISDVQGFKLRR